MARFETSSLLFQLVCQKTKILHRIKFNQEILTKLLKRMHWLSINLLCSSDYQTTYSFCEIKHFLKQANSLFTPLFLQQTHTRKKQTLIFLGICGGAPLSQIQCLGDRPPAVPSIVLLRKLYCSCKCNLKHKLLAMAI